MKQKYRVITHHDNMTFTEWVEARLEQGYKIVSSGNFHDGECPMYWAHLLKDDV